MSLATARGCQCRQAVEAHHEGLNHSIDRFLLQHGPLSEHIAPYWIVSVVSLRLGSRRLPELEPLPHKHCRSDGLTRGQPRIQTSVRCSVRPESDAQNSLFRSGYCQRKCAGARNPTTLLPKQTVAGSRTGLRGDPRLPLYLKQTAERF